MNLIKTAAVAAIIVTISSSVLAAPAMPVQAQTTRAAVVAADTVSRATYTGVIVDASGLGLERTFSPLILDTNGRRVYGAENIDPKIAMSEGMVEYATSLEGAVANSRAGVNPLVVKAVAVRGGRNSVNRVNVVVSVDDGDRILQADKAASMLRRCAVVFVK